MIDVCLVPDLSTLMDSFNEVCCLPVALVAVTVAGFVAYRRLGRRSRGKGVP